MLILGHRGVNFPSAACTQNSLPAFTCAMVEADGFETDACLNADSEVYLIHPDKDNRIDWLLNADSVAMVDERRFDQLPTDIVQKLRLLDGEPIPTLRQVLEMVASQNDKVINIELKSAGVADAVIKLLKQNIIRQDAMIVSSFDHAMLVPVRTAFPAIKIGALIVSGDEEGRKIFPWLADSRATYVTLQGAMSSALLRDLQPYCFVMSETMVTEASAVIIDGHFPKAKLVGWTVSEKQGYDQTALLARLKTLQTGGKVAGMIVDNPRAFVEAWHSNSGK